jgi:hypothetical protein
VPNSIRFGRAAADSFIDRTTNLPSITAFTLMAWVKMNDVTTANDQIIFSFGNQSNDVAYQLYLAGSGHKFNLYNGSTTQAGTGAAPAAGVWHHIALTVNGSSGTNFLAYLDGVLDNSFTAAAISGLSLRVGSDGVAEFSLVNIAALKVWSRVLSAAEIAAEMPFAQAVNRGALNTEIPLPSTWEALDANFNAPDRAGVLTRWADYSGNGNEWTETGAIDTEPGPPIRWAPPRSRLPYLPFAVGAVIASGDTATPAAAVAMWVVPTPTVTLGTVTANPAVATATWVVPTPAVTLGTVTATPPPATAAWVVPTPTITLGTTTVTPVAAVATWAVPTVGVTLGGVSATPATAQSTWTALAPAVTLGTLTLTPASAVRTWVNPTPTFGGSGSAQPSAAMSTWVANPPGVVLGGISAAPAPALVSWIVPAPGVALGGVSVVPAPALRNWLSLPPSVLLGPVTLTPTPAHSDWFAIAPSLILGGVSVSPAAAIRVWQVILPRVIGGATIPPLTPFDLLTMITAYTAQAQAVLTILKARGFKATLRHYPPKSIATNRLTGTTAPAAFTDYPVTLAVLPYKSLRGSSDSNDKGTSDTQSRRSLIIAGQGLPVNPAYGDEMFTIEGYMWKVEGSTPLGPDNGPPLVHKTIVVR